MPDAAWLAVVPGLDHGSEGVAKPGFPYYRCHRSLAARCDGYARKALKKMDQTVVVVFAYAPESTHRGDADHLRGCYENEYHGTKP